MPEALAAATISAADALGQSHTHGSLEVGKQGDLVVIIHPDGSLRFTSLEAITN